ncbi:MAG: hypothetical protein WBX22_10250 [Silvibacterium sp.]
MLGSSSGPKHACGLRKKVEHVLDGTPLAASMTIALVSALAIGEFFTALVITAFVLGAEILEGLTVESSIVTVYSILARWS